MEMKLGTHVYYIKLHVSMTTAYCSNSFRHFSSNLLTVALMEMKLGQNAHYIVSMTTTYYLNSNKQPQAFTSSLLKLANGSIHGDETWYGCILQQAFFSVIYFYRGLAPFHRDIRRIV